MFAPNAFKFQSTSTKNTGSKKIKVGGLEFKNNKNIVFNPQKLQVAANNSFLSIGDKMQQINQSDSMCSGPNDAPLSALSNKIKKGQGLIADTNVGSGSNLQTMPIGNATNMQQMKPHPYPTQSTKQSLSQGKTGPHQRKQSMKHQKKMIAEPPFIL